MTQLENYNLEISEAKCKELWEQEKIFEFDVQSTKDLFIVDTPPPYVSADHLHAGHIMSYAQAEFIVRYKRMRGFNVLYPMGFDDNGLPTERFVENKYKIDKSNITRSEFIQLCLQETEAGSKTYKELWKNLGISIDWSKTYSTIDPRAIKTSQWSILDLYKKGALYRQEAPVLSCTRCKTALAQADLEDKKEDSLMNYIHFKTENGENLLIATSRPELIPACVALYVHPEDKRYQHLIGTQATVPLFHYKIPIIGSEKVLMDFGTGLMMVSTWGDKEDMEKWKIDRLQTRAVINPDGTLNELAGKYSGLQVTEARKQIIDDLKSQNLLERQENIQHVLNIHERCSTPTEFILSKQWFIKIADLKDTWLKYAKEINWYPEFKAKDYEIWINAINWDWCISRQRFYGVPLPIWYCSKCQEPIFASEEELPVNPNEAKPKIQNCPKCNGEEFIPENDVMDTWATSSCTPFLLKELIEDQKLKMDMFPVSLRPNAFEIIRTWDFYSIVKSHYHFGKAPFKNIMISGHGLDENGKKISKRLGNYIPANKLVEKYGADAIRYWATGANLGQNLRFSLEEIQKGKKTTTKLWNIAKFLGIHLENFDFDQQLTHLEYADLWILQEFNETVEKVTEAFESYDYAKAKGTLDIFFWSKLADHYIEFIKYRLFKEDHNSKKSALSTLYSVFLELIKLYAPILPFITEEIYQQLFKVNFQEKSLHISEWPKTIFFSSNLGLDDFEQAIIAIDEIRKFKSDQKISLGTELEEYILKTKVDLEKYGSFIQNAIRVKKITLTKV